MHFQRLNLLLFLFGSLVSAPVFSQDEDLDDEDFLLAPERPEIQALSSVLIKVQRLENGLINSNDALDYDLEIDFTARIAGILLNFELGNLEEVQAEISEEFKLTNLNDVESLFRGSSYVLDSLEREVLSQIFSISQSTQDQELQVEEPPPLTKESASTFKNWKDKVKFLELIERFPSRVVRMAQNPAELSEFINQTKNFSDTDWIEIISVAPETMSAVLELATVQASIGQKKLKQISKGLDSTIKERLTSALKEGEASESKPSLNLQKLLSSCSDNVKAVSNLSQ